MEVELKQEPCYSSEQVLPEEEVEIPTEIKTEPTLSNVDESGCEIIDQKSANSDEKPVDIEEQKMHMVISEPTEESLPSITTISDIETLESQQQFVIVSSEAAPTEVPKMVNAVAVETVDGASSDYLHPAKFIRLQGENGQTYMLAISAPAPGDLLAEQDEDPTTSSETEIKPKEDQRKSPERKASKQSKNSCTGTKEDVTQAWFTTRDDKNNLQNHGHTWKQGQWTKSEVDLLKKNIDQYCAERDIEDATEIIFQMSKDERKDFYRTIAKGLERPLFSVYRRVTRMYDQKNHVGRYSPEEIEKLRDLRVTFGNDWISIGTALGRSASSVKDKCRLMKDKCNSGKWLLEEEKRLTAAVYDLAKRKPGEQVTSGLSWASVSELVVSRSEKQCRTKWLNYLNWKEVGGTEWTRQDDVQLILRLSDLDVENESDIDWNELCQGWPSARSPQWLRGKWWSLKRHINNYQNLSFSHVVSYLKSIYIQIKHVGTASSVDDVNVALAVHVPDHTGATVEVLQEWPTDASGSLIISHPQTTSSSALTFAGSSIPSEQIIVQTVPLHIEKVHENVSVQVNPQIIVNTDSTDEECQTSYANIINQSLALPLKVEQDLNSLSQNRDLDDGSLDGGVVKYEVLSSNETFESQTVTDSGLPSEGVQADIGHSVQSDIVQSEGESSNLDW